MFRKVRLRALGDWVDRAGTAVVASRSRSVRNSRGRARVRVDLVTGSFLIGIEQGRWVREPVEALQEPVGYEELAPASDSAYVMCALLMDEVWRRTAVFLLPATDHERSLAEAVLASDPAARKVFRATMEHAGAHIRALLEVWGARPAIGDILRAILTTHAVRAAQAATYANALH